MTEQRDVRRLESGVRNLDALFGGGIPRGTVLVVGGAPGSGKTVLVQQICFHNATPTRRLATGVPGPQRPPVGKGGAVTLRARASGDAVTVSVTDDGTGIAADELPRLFERFWRARAPSAPGMGLGLYIVKALVEAHGGKVWVESAHGAGSTFSFTLPRAPRPS